MRNVLILLLVAYIGSTSAFSIQPNVAFSRPASTSLFAADDKEGGAAIAKPKVGVKTETVTKQKAKSVSRGKAKSSEPVHRRDEDFEDAPLYRVMLIGDVDYEQAHVIERMTEILEEMDESAAASIFKQAQAGGKAMCGKYPLEHAEMYKEQFVRSDPMIFSDVEEENKVD